MVDINYLYNNNDLGSYLSSTLNYDDQCQQQSSNCDVNLNDNDDYLENIDENDLLNFESTNPNNNIVGIDTSNVFFLETPPETPVNYSSCLASGNSSFNQKDINANNLFSEKLFDNDCSDILDGSPLLNDNNSLTISITAHHGSPPIVTTTPANDLISPTLSSVNCTTNHTSPSKLSPPPSSITTVVNGYNLDHTIARNTKIFDSYHVSKNNNIQPKIILPGKVSNNKLIIDPNHHHQHHHHHHQQQQQNREKLTKLQKLEARKLRNREAALNSRLKKKEYVENLETQILDLKKENSNLLLENALLNQKINDLQTELSKIRDWNLNDTSGYAAGNNNNNNKARLGYFAIIFMLVFQVSPYIVSISSDERIIQSKNVERTSGGISDEQQQHHLSRTLLGLKYKGPAREEYFDVQQNDNYNSTSIGGYFQANQSTTKCGDYYNRTELMRLENELRDYLTRFKLDENNFKQRYMKMQQHHHHHHQQRNKKQNAKKLLYDLKHVPIPRLKMWMQKQQRYMDYLNDELNDHDHHHDSYDQFFPFNFETLMSTIHRRDDTFYYLSYPSKGHLILPPMSNRTDIRPRFSFLIPTFYNFSPNKSNTNTTSNNVSNHDHHQNRTGTSSSSSASSLAMPQLFMLQIDCQVINTKITLANVDGGVGGRHHPHRFTNKSSNDDVAQGKLFKSPDNK